MKKSISDKIKAALLSSILIPSLILGGISLPVLADGYGEQGVGVDVELGSAPVGTAIHVGVEIEAVHSGVRSVIGYL